MKTKILNALKTEYANLGLGEKAFDGVASFLEKTITEEAKIGDAIKEEGVKNLLKSIQGESDALRNKATKAAKDLEDYKKAHPETQAQQTETQQTETEPEWAKKIREQNEALAARLDSQEKARKQQQNLESVTAALKAAGCTQEEVLRLSLVGFALGENETEEAAVTRIKSAYDASVKKIYGEGGAPTPKGFVAPPAQISAADKAAKAREDAKRVRES